MTEARVRHLMAVVRLRFRQAGLDPGSAPEYDDMLAEAYFYAWRAVERLPADCPYSWQTIAGREALIAAAKYRGRRASGRMRSRQLQTPGYRARWCGGEPISDREREAHRSPVPLSSLTPTEQALYEPAWDGGLAAADARLQLWLLSPRLTEAQRTVLRLLYREHLSMSEAARRLGISHNSAVDRYEAALRKYRQAAGIEHAPR